MTVHLQSTLEHWINSGKRKFIHAYLLLDGSWQEQLAESIRAKSTHWEPLIGPFGLNKGQSHPRAPIIVDLAQAPEFIPDWLATGFQTKLGIVVFSELKLEALRVSLKRFTSVLTPESSRPAYLRLYDGRALGCFLQTGFATQWDDFFRNISLIAAPSDYSKGWALYRRVPEGLQIEYGFDERPAAPKAFVLKGENKADEPYDAYFPYRKIGKVQYERMNQCSEQALDSDVYDFFSDALPEQAAKIRREDALIQIRRSRAKAITFGYDTEECIFYWSLISLIVGESFYLHNVVSQYLQVVYVPSEAKLEEILKHINLTLKNKKIDRLIKVWTVTYTYADGVQKSVEF